MVFDVSLLSGLLTFAGPARSAVRTALAAAPRVRLDTAGTSTLTLECIDPDHELPAQLPGLTATAAGVTWSPVALKRREDRVTLVLEDDVVVRLRKAAGPLSVPAGSTTVNELATRLTHPVDVPVLLEPTRHTVRSAFTSFGSAWKALGDLATVTDRWRYSDGTRLVMATPTWLLTQPAVELREDAGDLGTVEYCLDVSKDHDVAAATISTPPALGDVIDLVDLGPASGRWLTAAYSTTLGEDTGRVTYVRPRSDELWC